MSLHNWILLAIPIPKAMRFLEAKVAVNEE